MTVGARRTRHCAGQAVPLRRCVLEKVELPV
jgi:hypothetical protein